jgi:PGF-CTERM protein
MQRLFRLLFLVAVLGGLCVASAGAVGAQSQVTLTVSVVDQADDPVGAADVTVSWDGGETSATTASNGRAFVDVPEGEDVTIDVEHDDYVRNEALEVEDATEDDVTVRVSRKGNSTVTAERADGDPIPNATIQFRQDGTTVVQGETNESGVYQTGVVEQGEYDVRAVKPGFLEQRATYSVGVDTERTFELERGSVELNVTVVDDHFDPPRVLENSRVRITDDRGVVATFRVPGGSATYSIDVNDRYDLTVLKDGYVEAETAFTVRERETDVEAATRRLPNLTLTSQNERVVVGERTTLTVVNAYEEPVEGAEIRHDGETVAETDANGEAVVTVDDAGPQEFTAETDDADSAPITVEGFDPGGDETTEPTATETEAEIPGFGPLVAVIGVLGASLLVARRRGRRN